jgi:putative hydrolase of the HAD superfamily
MVAAGDENEYIDRRLGSGSVGQNRAHLYGNRQHLLIDADDTLWENNRYFEVAIAEFIDFLDHSTLTTAEVRAVLDEIELANTRVHGYGAQSFARNLRQTYERLAERHIRAEDLAVVMDFGERILRQENELMPGVAGTLPVLAARHDLVLLTKGHPEEQRLKIDRSGLEGYFSRAVIVAEKDEGVYRRIVGELGFDPARTWMIGNSPKSDINPALAAGLNAVFVPHAWTWRLEHQEVAEAEGRLLVLERFSDLLTYF